MAKKAEKLVDPLYNENSDLARRLEEIKAKIANISEITPLTPVERVILREWLDRVEARRNFLEHKKAMRVLNEVSESELRSCKDVLDKYEGFR
jgi:hypothetical protein